MRVIPPALAAHLAGGDWTLATLWTITRTDGKIFRFTDHDVDIHYNGETFKAAIGYVPSAYKQGIDTSPNNMQTRGLISDLGITAQDLSGGLFDNARVDLAIVNWAAPDDGIIPLPKGWIGEVGAEGQQFAAELRGLAQRLSTSIGRLITPGCDADLGDTRCGVDLSALEVAGTVPGVYSIDTIRWTFTDWVGKPGATISVFEVEVRASPGGPDQCTAPNIGASAQGSVFGDTPNKAFDDNTSTRWRDSDAVSTWLQFDFFEDQTADLYEYWFFYSPTDTPKDWTVEVKLAGSPDWTLIDTVSDWNDNVSTAFVVTRPPGTPTGSRVRLFDPARTEADDYWIGGRLVFTSGPNAAQSRDVKASSAKGSIELWEPLPYEILVGDTYTLTPGCDKRRETCRDRYSNIVRFRGFPDLRGIPDLIRGPQ